MSLPMKGAGIWTEVCGQRLESERMGHLNLCISLSRDSSPPPHPHPPNPPHPHPPNPTPTPRQLSALSEPKIPQHRRRQGEGTRENHSEGSWNLNPLCPVSPNQLPGLVGGCPPGLSARAPDPLLAPLSSDPVPARQAQGSGELIPRKE